MTPKSGFFPVRPPEPMQLFAVLTNVFPQFDQKAVIDDVRNSDVGLHCVMRHFTYYVGVNHSQFSKHQLISLGKILDEAVVIDDKLENAVATCMLEHLHQVNAYKAISPYLSKKSKEKTKP